MRLDLSALLRFLKKPRRSMLEYALSQAGDNRKELEYVINTMKGIRFKKKRPPAFDTQYGLSFRI